ncbi:acyl-CoA thioesterase [Sapientia aquatica]|uniref:Acyl-CoA thioesterase n=1 Tax=Sapientia aquatica TaxID=1549640 RepID=A0A4R5W484_9BURK|nr:thioesterase family protein [Sapientia aquatica]TDK67520.1 acyl-CoA thioesterase [Sapientia aquatica]
MIFTTNLKIRFGHVDPAGIVFYPRYFEFFNTVIEEWCEQALGAGFNRMHTEFGYTLPMVNAECAFIAPTTLGETLVAQLSLSKMGNSSIHVGIELLGEDLLVRIRAKLVLVLMDLESRRAIPLTESLRELMAPYLNEVDGR